MNELLKMKFFELLSKKLHKKLLTQKCKMPMENLSST